ncbi:MAG: hypothetical protein CR986_10520 [Ignavibacteriae bacterium]|nr:MAG: hypothetical protein CR986_10520 [Ignavibacteriota bacterium]
MKNYLFKLFALLFFSTSLIGQADTVLVPSVVDGEPFGAINKFIIGDTTSTGERVNPERYYKLEKNKIYFLNGEFHAHFDLRLIADDVEDGEKPPIVASTTGSDGTIQLIQFNLFGDAYIKNIIFQMTPPSGNGESNASFFLSKLDGNYEFDNVRWEWGLWTAIAVVIPLNKIKVTNCYFRNPQHKTNIFNGRGITFYQENPADTVIIQNNTFFNINSFSFVADNSSIPPGLLLFDHNTIVNQMKWPIHSYWITNAVVTNNIFFNSSAFGENHQDTEGQDPERLQYGLINIYPAPQDILDYHGVTEAERSYICDRNAYYFTDDIKDYWAEYELPDVPFMNSRTQGMFDDDANYPNLYLDHLYYADPKFKEDGEGTEQMIAWMKRKRDWQQNTYWGWDPDGNKFEVQWPFPEDFTYSNEELMTAADRGFPLGDLNWYPELKTRWLEGDTIVGNSFVDFQPKDLIINEVYPNPFNDYLRFDISLKNSSKVSLSIIDLNGKIVDTVNKGKLSSGNHIISWKTQWDNLNEGIYLYQIKTDKNIITGKIEHIK